MEEDTEGLLRAPSDTVYEAVERLPSSYIPFRTFQLEKAKQYQQQYSDMYFLRLTTLKPIVEAIAAEAWDSFQIAGEEVRKVERVLDVRQGELCWVTGTIYMEMPLKPNILEDISRDHWIPTSHLRQKFVSLEGQDRVMLEDESGRLRLMGASLATEILVTGCIVAVMGTENANGEFEVVDVRVPDLAPQPARWSATDAASDTKIDPRVKDEDEEMADTPRRGNGGKIAIVSGLEFSSNNASTSLQNNLLLEYLVGEALDPALQSEASKISRLIIAGNSIATDNDHGQDGARKTTKKYGYDSSAYNPIPTAHLDEFLASVLHSIPVTLIPGASDTANASLPQQPIHSAMFPQARAFASHPSGDESSTEPNWFDTVTNPWDGEVDGWRVLGAGGQNVDDVFKYVESVDRLGMMEAMCRWRCCAPTAPDTLWSYPFQNNDPFVLRACPHLFFVGSQPKFDTAVIGGSEGQMVRLISIPKFSESGMLVLVDTETLEVEKVLFEVFDL